MRRLISYLFCYYSTIGFNVRSTKSCLSQFTYDQSPFVCLYHENTSILLYPGQRSHFQTRAYFHAVDWWANCLFGIVLQVVLQCCSMRFIIICIYRWNSSLRVICNFVLIKEGACSMRNVQIPCTRYTTSWMLSVQDVKRKTPPANKVVTRLRLWQFPG